MSDPSPHTGRDLAASLRELERRLHELEQELADPGPPLPPPPPPPPPAPDTGAAQSARELRDRVERSARTLLADCDRLLDALGAAAPPESSRSGPGRVGGAVRLDAGPFASAGELARFEAALAALPHLEEVLVRGFGAGRADIDIVLGAPIDLLDELRRRTPLAVRSSSGAGRALRLDLGPER